MVLIYSGVGNLGSFGIVQSIMYILEFTFSNIFSDPKIYSKICILECINTFWIVYFEIYFRKNKFINNGII